MAWQRESVLVLFLFVIDSTSGIGFDYVFDVHPVSSCPLSKEGWEQASSRLKCNSTHGYHCVPTKNLNALVEFCYPKGVKLPFEKGNCLELASNGILNQVKCTETFQNGCPDRFYFSNELYKFPKCLMINNDKRCFDADIPCICSMQNVKYQQKLTDSMNRTVSNQQHEHFPMGTAVAVIAVLLGSLYTVVVVVFILKIQKRMKQRNNRNKKEKGKESIPMIEERVSLVDDEISNFISENVNMQKLQDMILHGNKQGFENLINGFNKDSLEKLNNHGLNCLHLAAKGHFDIFNRIIRQGVNIEMQADDGRNVFHIAAHKGSYRICEFILQKHKNLFSFKDRYAMNPAHWAALGGQRTILELMMKYDCNLKEETDPYKENIVLFACMGKSLAVCDFVGKNDSIRELLHAKNREGWNSIQYAAKSGNIDVFRFLVEHGVDIENKSKKTGKNCLHSACEKGHEDICRYILKNKYTLLTDRDKNDQHIGHFAAKSWNVEIMNVLLEKSEKSFLQKANLDNINILHIACRHARFDMCVKIVEEFPFMIGEVTEKGWNAALFLTERAGAETERIKILKYLVDRKLNVFHVSRSGKTMLFNACANRSTQLVEYLLERFPELPNIEKSMDPLEAAHSEEISTIFRMYYRKIYVC